MNDLIKQLKKIKRITILIDEENQLYEEKLVQLHQQNTTRLKYLFSMKNTSINKMKKIRAQTKLV